MKTTTDMYVPRALRDVWEWKDAAARQTRHMTTAEALVCIHREAEDVRRRFGFLTATPSHDAAAVAESPAPYRAGEKKP